MARLSNLAFAKPVSSAFMAAGAGSPLVSLVPYTADVADQVLTMWGALRSGWSARYQIVTICEAEKQQRRGAENIDAGDNRSPRGRSIAPS